jgi:hypothetical protein
MAGVNAKRNSLYNKYRKQGLGEEEALMRADSESQVSTPAASVPKQEKSWVTSLGEKIKKHFSKNKPMKDYNKLLKQGYTPRDIIRMRNR